jgi:hypothetical protein
MSEEPKKPSAKTTEEKPSASKSAQRQSGDAGTQVTQISQFQASDHKIVIRASKNKNLKKVIQTKPLKK